MDKKAAFFLALGLTSLSAPAFATHPNEACRISIDLGSITRALGSDAARVRVRLEFHTNLTDMNPPAAEMVSRPAEGPWVYTREVHSSLYERRLSAVVIESALYKPEDGKPVWSIKVERPQDDQKKDSPIRCEVYAD